MVKSIIEFSVLKLKNRQIKIDPNVGDMDLLSIIFVQLEDYARGLLRLRTFVSIGRKVTLRAKKKMQIGKGVSIGNYSTIDSLGVLGLKIGAGSSIGAFSILKVSGTLASIGKEISIGNNVGIGEFAHIGGAGGVSIGDNTIVGPYLSIHPENHVFTDTEKLIREQGVTRKGIEIGSNCWVGAKVTVLDGSKVGHGCVIAAGAVVNGEFPNNVVIGGVPARILKER